MSNGYAIDIYGIPFYGYSQPVDYSVAPFLASQTNYGKITLTWSSPNTTSWKLLHLVRSTYGYPSSAIDGVLLQEIVPGNITKTFDDTGLIPGTIYYYSMFITVEAPAWNSGTTYNLNNQVLFNGTYWASLQNSNTNHTPAAGSAFWTSTAYVPTWYPAGFTATLALANQGYSGLLYNRTPQPYKIATSDTFSNTSVDNKALQDYLSLFGFGLDIMKGTYDSYLQLNNPDVVSAASLDILAQELGLNLDYLATPQQRRQRVKNAAVDYQMKGQTQSIHNLIAELAGWDSSITYGPNMLNTEDQSAFAHPKYDVWNSNTTYFVGNLVQFSGYNYKNLVQSVGLAQAPTGNATSNTWWQPILQTIDAQNFLSNPGTGLFSTWSMVPNGVTAAFNGILAGLPHPTNAAINNWNALAFHQTNNFGSGYIDVNSTAPIATPNYSNGTNYVVGNFVLATDGFYYQALAINGPGSTVVAPGTNNKVWQAFYYVAGDLPNTIKDGNPLPQFAVWDNVTQYAVGNRVQYFGIIYVATNPNMNFPPTGNYYSNINWTFLQPSEAIYTSSAYHGSLGPGAVYNSDTTPKFYDINGKLLTSYSTATKPLTAYGTVSRFIYDYNDLNGTTDPTMLNVRAIGGLSSSNWAATPSTATLWRSSYGMAYVDPTLAGTTLYEYLIMSSNQVTNVNTVGITFATDYADTAHKAHGIIIQFIDANNFLYATRKTLYSVVAGVETSLASWTRLLNGDRMLVTSIDGGGFNTVVYKYARDGQGTLTTLATVPTPAAFNAGGKVGLIHKYSASGAV